MNTDTDMDTDTDTDTAAPADIDTDVPQGCRGPIDFPDEYLLGEVRSASGKYRGDITYDDVYDLIEFSANGGAISDLTGIQCLTNLTSLELELDIYGADDDCLSMPLDISPLAGLTNLNILNLNMNIRISDISALAGLTKLNDLYLSRNQISDISALAGLTNLDVLYLSHNQISDISALLSNSGVGSGDTVYVIDNPLDCDDAATRGDITTLEERGVHLVHDCPDVDTDSFMGL